MNEQGPGNSPQLGVPEALLKQAKEKLVLVKTQFEDLKRRIAMTGSFGANPITNASYAAEAAVIFDSLYQISRVYGDLHHIKDPAIIAINSTAKGRDLINKGAISEAEQALERAQTFSAKVSQHSEDVDNLYLLMQEALDLLKNLRGIEK